MADTKSTLARALPMKDTFTEPYWAGAKEGKLLVQRSKQTGKLQWPPRPRMLPDWDVEPEWTPIAGEGTVYSYSVIYRSSHSYPPTPYVLAVVELKDGLFFTTNIVGVDPAKVRIGMKVKVEFEKLDDESSLAVFSPVTKE